MGKSIFEPGDVVRIHPELNRSDRRFHWGGSPGANDCPGINKEMEGMAGEYDVVQHAYSEDHVTLVGRRWAWADRYLLPKDQPYALNLSMADIEEMF